MKLMKKEVGKACMCVYMSQNKHRRKQTRNLEGFHASKFLLIKILSGRHEGIRTNRMIY